MTVISLNSGYYPDTTIGRPVSEGSLYVGEPYEDPEEYPKDAFYIDDNGESQLVTQPIKLNAGGIPIYPYTINGTPRIFVTSGSYSLKVEDSLGTQKYYIPVNTDLTPSGVTLSYYDCNLKDAIVGIGSDKVTLVIDCIPVALEEDLAIPSNITLEWLNGYLLTGAYTLTVEGEINAGHYPLFAAGLTGVTFSSDFKSEVKALWFEDTLNDLGGMLNRCLAANSKTIVLPVSQNLSLSTAVSISSLSSLQIKGAGKFSTQIIVNTAGNAFNIVNSDYITLKDFHLYRNQTPTLAGIQLSTSDNCVFENIHTTAMTFYGIHALSCNRGTVINYSGINSNTYNIFLDPGCNNWNFKGLTYCEGGGGLRLDGSATTGNGHTGDLVYVVTAPSAFGLSIGGSDNKIDLYSDGALRPVFFQNANTKNNFVRIIKDINSTSPSSDNGSNNRVVEQGLIPPHKLMVKFTHQEPYTAPGPTMDGGRLSVSNNKRFITHEIFNNIPDFIVTVRTGTRDDPIEVGKFQPAKGWYKIKIRQVLAETDRTRSWLYNITQTQNELETSSISQFINSANGLHNIECNIEHELFYFNGTDEFDIHIGAETTGQTYDMGAYSNKPAGAQDELYMVAIFEKIY
jgi:hypothetical protein